jgi:hypothetical protein
MPLSNINGGPINTLNISTGSLNKKRIIKGFVPANFLFSKYKERYLSFKHCK